MTQFKEIKISEIFTLKRWKSIYTKQYWNKNKWDYPVYSAWQEKLTSINTYDFNWEFLTWATNWFAWYLKKLNWKFSLNADRGIFIKTNDLINIDFINFSIEYSLRALTKWRIWDRSKNEFTKLSPQKIKDHIFVKIPIDKNWEFDLEKQKEIAKKYDKIEKIKNRLKIMKEDIEENEISLENEYNWIEKSLTELFEIKQWDAFYTKKRILENNWIWNIPIYSSNTKGKWLLVWIKKEFIKEKDLYFQNCLTWSIDWYAWKIFIRNQNNLKNKEKNEYFFTINNHCWIMLPKISWLFLPFIKIILQHKFFERAKWYWNNKLWNNQIDNLTLNIPIKNNWEFDLEKQKEITLKYKKIEKIKNNLIQELEYLEKVKIEI